MANLKKLFENPTRIATALLAVGVVGAVGWQLVTQWQASRAWETNRNTGQALRNQARFAEAEGPLDDALTAARKLGPQDPRLDQALVDLAEAREAQGKTDDVIYLRQQSLENRITRFGAVSPQAASAFHELADAYYSRAEYVTAEGIFDMALDTWERLNAGEQTDAAKSHLGRGRAREKQGKLDRAEEDFTRALTVQEKTLGADSADLAPTLRALARVVQARGDSNRASALEHRLAALVPAATPGQPGAPQ